MEQYNLFKIYKQRTGQERNPHQKKVWIGKARKKLKNDTRNEFFNPQNSTKI